MSGIHPLADVRTTKIGANTNIWQFAVVLAGAQIGSSCNINCHTFIENDVIIGNHVTVKSGVYLWDGIVAEDHTFIGPNVTFTNDKYPRSQQHLGAFQKTILKTGCSVGAGATILGGVTIGSFAIIGAGTIVTKDVPAFALFYGTPGRVRGWVNEKGAKLAEISKGQFADEAGNVWFLHNNLLVRK
ncbi:N-acetyltransferase [Mucilaginibacter sp. BJC16-A38]|uniref:acyltransferase n=1 Tax=Mucilaginibacter phenanthrenivorans TaxID=1234842 RepID=UPI00280B20D3|nr:acyltransferase [Mucilaginibacter phenanthrenivorans]MCR8560196.1 N-acetyltransferase [Mucilaginibacter phenanthrenivorans]